MTLNEYLEHDRASKLNLAFNIAKWLVIMNQEDPEQKYKDSYTVRAGRIINGEQWNITLAIEKATEEKTQ